MATKNQLSQWNIEKNSNVNAQISAVLAAAEATNKGVLSDKRKSNLIKRPKFLICIPTLADFQG